MNNLTAREKGFMYVITLLIIVVLGYFFGIRTLNNKYEDYKVTITGYVNPDGEKWTKEEVLLALRRAQSVENRLRELGVDPNRMKALAGDGKTNNKEYNRRVEFKLEK